MPHPAPEDVAGIRHEMIHWYREYAPQIWPTQHLGGSQFVAPPCLPPIRAKAAGFEINPLTQSALQFGDRATEQQFARLAEYYATAMEEARSYYIGQDLSHLALRTEMPQYRLTLDMLPAPSGFLIWALPVGAAEHFVPRTAMVDLRGNVTDNTDPDSIPLSPFHDVEAPIIGASWRYEKDDHSLWVVFYTRNEAVLGKLAETMTPSEIDRARQLGGPISFEREQLLPLDETLEWFDAAEGARITLTAHSAVDSLPAHLRDFGKQRDADVLPSMTQMVRALVATFMLMKWKIAAREEIAPPPYVAREIAQRTGQTKGEAKATNKTVFVKLGAPLKHRKPSASGGSRKWKVRAIIGPFIRTRQYIPAHDTYDLTPRLIEPYIAGPEGAPFSDAAQNRVFLFD